MKEITARVLVIGTGCAGYAAAENLARLGVPDVLLLSAGVERGTSRNTGSDKQTYYKLSLAADRRDSVYDMAHDLFDGGCVNGDTALCEAAGSVRAFLRLNDLGVPFPTNRFGEFVGYRTDHDSRMRATSAGPLTSKLMTEALQRATERAGVPTLSPLQAVRLITKDNRVHGVLALDTSRLHDDFGLTLICTPLVVLSTGGPALAYDSVVYPESQSGGTGMALNAGAEACNLNQWQYGLASTSFRWNLSGSYQQVLPRYVSVDEHGEQHEFLPEALGSAADALNMTFLKGYQWPFDSTKAADGSSRVDLAVHAERMKGRRVYLDYAHEPMGMDANFTLLSPEAREYLTRSDCLVPTPIERLRRMNPQAVQLYRSHGIDLSRELLPIAVCAQHCNGGLAVDADWRTSIDGLYCAGEAAGTFGIARPGGSALNSTQVGAQRAAEHIAYAAQPTPTDEAACEHAVQALRSDIQALLTADAPHHLAVRRRMQTRMTQYAAFSRDVEQMQSMEKELSEPLKLSAQGISDLPAAFDTLDALAVQRAMLSAMLLSAETSGSLGSALVPDTPAGDPMRGHTLRTRDHTSFYVPVRPLPRSDDWFETVWREFNASRGIR
ncbi:MAG: FAD-binding protein [Candidatus Spyradocola sp.]